MNLITFNLDDKLLSNSQQKLINNKKKILFHHAYQQNKYFQKKNKYKVAKLHEFHKDKNLSKQLKFVNKNYNILLTYLSKKLNEAHNKKSDNKYWEIIIGKWLKTFVYQMSVNWEILNKIEKKYKIKSFTKIIMDDYTFIPKNTWHAHVLTRSGTHKYNLFHHWTISKMIDHKKNIKNNYLTLKNNLIIKDEINKLDKPLRYQNIFYKSFDNKIFYYLWDIPRKIKIELMKKFRFINIPINNPVLKQNKSINYDRDNLFKNHNKKINFESFLKNIIKYTFPKIFLEDFNMLQFKYKSLSWPKKPEYIFTTFPYYDELFKFYCAENYKSGSKLIITQHGYDNIYEHDDWHVNKMFKTQLSWGENKKKNLKTFLFTKNYIKRKTDFKFEKNKKILVSLYSFTEMEEKFPNGYLDNFSINKNIFNSTIKYLKNLKRPILKKNEIKALQLTRYPILKNSIKKKYKNIKFMGIEKPFKKIILDYNLSVHFFIGTPFFESLYLNRPTIVIFDQKTHSRFDKKFKLYLKKFKDNQICFDNPKDAAKFINKNYQTLDKWWNLPERQKIIDEFCELFCKRSINLDEELKNIIKF